MILILGRIDQPWWPSPLDCVIQSRATAFVDWLSESLPVVQGRWFNHSQSIDANDAAWQSYSKRRPARVVVLFAGRRRKRRDTKYTLEFFLSNWQEQHQRQTHYYWEEKMEDELQLVENVQTGKTGSIWTVQLVLPAADREWNSGRSPGVVGTR